MNVTFLIGNGFDLACGLKTSYRDFLKYYMNVTSDSNNITHFKETISMDLDTWADAEIAFGKYTEKYDSDNVSAFRECYDDFVNQLSTYLGQQEKRFNIDNLARGACAAFERGLLYFDSFLTEDSKDKLLELYEWEPFDERLFNVLTFNYTRVFEELYNRIQDEEDPAMPSKLINSHSCENYLLDVVYVHGDRRKLPLVFGVDNTDQISNPSFRALPRFVRSIVKPDGNKHLRKRIFNQCNEIINESSIICVYGMSIGLTDSIWWEVILNWLRKNHTHQLIQYVYAPKCIRDSVGSYADALDDCREHLYSRLLLSSAESSDFRDQIHIELNVDLFGVEKTVSPYLDMPPEFTPF
jgi:hypothetical protein